MEEETRKDAPTQEASAAASSNLGATLLRVAWLAILLGMAMEGILLLLSAGLGNLLGLGPIVADLARNVSWSLLVCVGLSVGTAVQKARVPVMGFLGFLAAPPRSKSPAWSIRERSKPWQSLGVLETTFHLSCLPS
jgi:hypothetical protein